MGIPSIIVPYPYAAENHQVYNAKVIEKAGAGKVILEQDLNGDILNSTLEDMIYNKGQLEKMSKEAKKLAVFNVEDKIYTEIKKLVK